MNYKWILIGVGILLILLLVYKKRNAIMSWFGKKPVETQPLLREEKQYQKEIVNNDGTKPGEEYVVLEIASSPEEGKEIILGELFVKLHDDICPRSCENFRSLAKIEYKGCVIHRLIKGFMVQMGDYENSNGTGGKSIWGPKFPDENFILKNKKYTLSLANSGPDTNGSQFFINFADNKFLDGKHVVFGEVIKGFDLLDVMENMPTNETDEPVQLLYIRNTRFTNSMN